MPACEKCWKDAYLRAEATGRKQVDCYLELLEERESSPCSPREKAGKWWNEEKQKDSREV